MKVTRMSKVASVAPTIMRSLWPFTRPLYPHHMEIVASTVPSTIKKNGTSDAHASFGGAHALFTFSDHRYEYAMSSAIEPVRSDTMHSHTPRRLRRALTATGSPVVG